MSVPKYVVAVSRLSAVENPSSTFQDNRVNNARDARTDAPTGQRHIASATLRWADA